MTAEEALQVLVQAAARAPLPWREHAKWQAAAQILRQAIVPAADGPETDAPADADSSAEP